MLQFKYGAVEYDALNHATTLGALAWPLRGLAPVLDDITAFIAAAP